MSDKSLINIYVNLVMNGRRTIESLPEAYRQIVQEQVNGKNKQEKVSG